MTIAHALDLDTDLRQRHLTANTRASKARALRRILRWLWEYHGAPKLDSHIRHYPAGRPRNVTVTDQERAALLSAAPPHLRLWLLLCSDLAMRSGTAAAISPAHYDADTGTLTFTTKCDEHLTLPATAELRAILDTCDQTTSKPYVSQLWSEYHRSTRHPGRLTAFGTNRLRNNLQQLAQSLGITRRICAHDLRRTTAVAMLRATRDVREVQALLGHKNLQSTLWYLDHDLRPIKRATLELIKTPTWRKEQIA